ncbi:MAG TPA: ComEC/Rec2 family competence protein [Candidatus Dormibacteraeota bacterium]
MNRLAGSGPGRWAGAIWGAFAAGAGLGCAAGVGGAAPALAVAGVVAASVALALLRRRRAGLGARHHAAALSAALIAAALLGVSRGATSEAAPGPHRIDGHLGSRPVAVVGTVRETQPGGGGPVTVDVERVADGDSDVQAGGGLLVTGSTLPAVAPGDRVEVDAAGLRAPDRRPGPESAATLERKDVEAVAVSPLVSITSHGGLGPARVVASAQEMLVHAVDTVLPEPQAALTLGVAFGIRQPLAAGVRQPLQDAGLIHIVVVSGLKVVILVSLVGLLARHLSWSPRRALLLVAPVVAGYVVLSGAGPAAVRSALMAGAAGMARQGGRRTDPLPMLALAAALMLGLDPPLVRDAGFQLSFLGTAGIVLLADPIARRLPGPRLLVEPFAVTVAAQVATLPVMAGTFGVIALLGPVVNALVLPLLPALIVIGGCGALAASIAPALGWPLLQLAGLGASLIVGIAQVAASLPGAAVHLAGWPAPWVAAEVAGLAAAALTACGVLSRRRVVATPRAAVVPPAAGQRPAPAPVSRARLLALVAIGGVTAAAAAGFAAARPDGLLHITALSTGAAPAVIVRGADGSLALVDGGSSPATLVQALGRVLSPIDHRLDLVVASGGEQAAVSGLAGLPGHYEVGGVLAARDMNPGGVKVVTALQSAGAVAVDPSGRAWAWGGLRWHCLGFRAQATDRAMCAVTVRGPGGSALILGDAGTADQEEIAAVYGPLLAADVLIAEPGGALAPVLLAAARPRVIVAPTAAGGVSAAAPPGYTVLRTGTQGDLRFDGGPGGLALAT